MTRATVWATLIGSLAISLIIGTPGVSVGAPSKKCQTEIETFCPAMQPGDGHYGQCLIDHEKAFSADCKRYAKEAAARKRDLSQMPNCVADAERLCPGSSTGVTRLMKCLRTHQGDLSTECRREIGKRSGKFH